MSHLESGALFQCLSTLVELVPFNQVLGMKLDQLDEKHAQISFKRNDTLIGNPIQQILHGGVICTVLDMIGGVTVMAAVINKHPEIKPEEFGTLISKCGTIDLQVSFLRPGKGELFTAKAWLLRSGNNVAFTRMELYNQKDSHIASASGTYWAQH